MNKHNKRTEENLRYRKRIAERGLIVSNFLMPVILIPEVKQFIRQRSQELLMKG